MGDEERRCGACDRAEGACICLPPGTPPDAPAIIAWRSLLTDACGSGAVMTFADAIALVERFDRVYEGKVRHFAAAPGTDPRPA